MPDLDDLLVKTSRTFALSIPRLPEPTRREVTIAYLLFRIADTFEDAARWPRPRRIAALETFAQLLGEPKPEETREAVRGWLAERPSGHEGYLELLAETPGVLDVFFSLAPEARDLVRAHTIRTARGMAEFVARTSEDGALQLRDIPDLQRYCYTVAGIVGEMLTELFLLGSDALQPIEQVLRERATRFGEALQLVNILKDSVDDAREGRCYLPADLDRAEVFALARQDLNAAREYVLALQRVDAPRGLVAFTALPVQLAWATLDRVEEAGPGSKLTRAEVFQIVDGLERALEQNRPAVAAG